MSGKDKDGGAMVNREQAVYLAGRDCAKEQP